MDSAVFCVFLSIFAAQGVAGSASPRKGPGFQELPSQTFSTSLNRMVDLTATRNAAWARAVVSKKALPDENYGVFLDAGSSGTRMYIFNWTEVVNDTGVVVQQNDVMKCGTTGLNAFRTNATAAGPSLKDCFDFARDNIPENKRHVTRVRLGATAGLRIVETEDPVASAAILGNITQYLKDNYNFAVMPGDIGILSPENETVFVWAAVNYAAQVFQNSSQNTWTSLYLGGASTDISMDVAPRPNETVFIQPDMTPTIFGRVYPLYIRNFICYGKDQVFKRFQAIVLKKNNFQSPSPNPCAAVGLDFDAVHTDTFEAACSSFSVPAEKRKDKYRLVGASNATECWALVKQLFTTDFNLNPSTCPFNDGVTCSLSSRLDKFFRGRILASGGFAYDADTMWRLSNKSFTIAPQFDINGQRNALYNFCGKTYPEVLDAARSNGVSEAFALRACIDGVYGDILLSEIYGLSDDVLRNTVFSRSVNGDDVSWTLGWALFSSIKTSPTSPTPSSSTSADSSSGSPASTTSSTTKGVGSSSSSPSFHIGVVQQLFCFCLTVSAVVVNVRRSGV